MQLSWPREALRKLPSVVSKLLCDVLNSKYPEHSWLLFNSGLIGAHTCGYNSLIYLSIYLPTFLSFFLSVYQSVIYFARSKITTTNAGEDVAKQEPL
jgi:hypothetical protein